MKRIVVCVVAFSCMTGAASAITWHPTKFNDPLTGEKVDGWEWGSYGSYIYQYPSKFDLVFWPLTDANWICVNAKNGYGAFNNDFEKISDDEKKTLSKWLKENYDPAESPKTHLEKLAWLEKVYKGRKMDDDFWSRFYRLMVYMHRKDKLKSLGYVKKVMPLLEKKLDTKPDGIKRIETLYLLGEYNRRLGNHGKTKAFFADVKTAKYTDEGGKEQVGHPYFLALISDREKQPIEPATTPDLAEAKQKGPD